MQKVVSALLVLLLLCAAAVFPIKVNAAAVPLQPPEIRSESAVLMDAVSGQILYQKNMNQKMYPASITKVLTALLALEKGDLSQTLTMSYDAVFSIDRNSSHIALDVDEKITLEQALYALSIASANEAANGIAEQIGGTVENFAGMMNEAAAQAGAENTNFTNPHGLPDPNNQKTAYDMAKITSAALMIPRFTEIFGATRYDIPPTNKQPETRMLWNSNKLLNGSIPYEGILMSKTGWTSESQHTLVSAAKRGDTTLIAVVMRSPNAGDKWKDTTALLDYGFDGFTAVKITKERLEKSSPTQIAAANNFQIRTAFAVADDVSLLLPAGETIDNLSITYGEPEIDEVKALAQLPVCINLPGSSSTDPAKLVDVDISMSSQISALKSKETMGDSSAQENASSVHLSEKETRGPIFLFFILLGGIALFLLKRRNIIRQLTPRRHKVRRKRINRHSDN